MVNLGDFSPGKTIRYRFNTHKATGEPITLAGTPSVVVYSSTDVESTAGITLSVDYDGAMGFHQVLIDTSADLTFYALAEDYDIVLAAGTVDGISVAGTKLATFSLYNRAGNVMAINNSDDAAINLASMLAGSLGTLTLTHLVISASDTLPTVLIEHTGLNAQPALKITATMSNAVLLSATLNHALQIFTSSGLHNDIALTGSGAMAANIAGNLVGNVTGNVSGKIIGGGVSTITGTGVQATVITVQAAALADFFDTNSGTTYASAVAGSVVKEIADNAGGSSAGDIADAVWDEVMGHTTSGTAGALLALAATAADYIGTARITVTSPISQAGDISITQGDSYYTTETRAIDWTGATANIWPDLTGATITFYVEDGLLAVTGSVITPTGTQKVRVELTSAQTATLPEGSCDYDVKAALLNGHVVTLVRGSMTVTDTEAA